MKMPSILLLVTSAALVAPGVHAQNSDFCQPIKSLADSLLAAPKSLHRSDRKHEAEFETSTPGKALPGAESCELSTSALVDGQYRYTSYHYKCEWPQNRGSSVADAMAQAETMGKAIAACMGGKQYVYDKPTREEWVTSLKRGEASIKIVTSSVKMTKYPRIKLYMGGLVP